MVHRRAKHKTIKICPSCQSTQISPILGGILGPRYVCEACGYSGALILEQDLPDDVE
ncbi:MAG: hypothetical protein L3K03_00340 [Thermoplasmata archaeon]|nr:hypothetical protein [Thermoplasmata archaeon]